MCLQCVADARIFGHIVPGWYFAQGRKDAPEDWPIGWYALGIINDPLVVWPGPIVVRPQPIIEGKHKFTPEENSFWQAVDTLQRYLYLPPERGEELCKAAREAGWTRGGLCEWVLERAAYLLANPEEQPLFVIPST